MPGKTPGVFTEVWAIVSEEHDRERLVAIHVQSAGWIQVGTGEPMFVDEVLPEARRLAAESGRRLKIVRFQRLEEQALPPEVASEEEFQAALATGATGS